MAIEAKLIVVEGAREAEISLKLPTIIGRSGEAALKVRTSVVSRKHCRLYEKNGGLYVEDLNSSNGTFVNEEKITAVTPIATGDFLTVGPVTLEVVCKNDERSMSHEPYFGDRGVLTESSSPDAESASNVHYQETIDGSFLGIDDSMPLKMGSAQASEVRDIPDHDPPMLKRVKRSPATSDQTGVPGGGVENQPVNDEKQQAASDKALDDFLNNIDE